MRVALALVGAVSCLALPGLAQGAEPLYAFAPQLEAKELPPSGTIDRPCGLAVGSGGEVYLSDHDHGTVDVLSPGDSGKPPALIAQLGGRDGPCGLALGPAGELYLNGHHREVLRFGASPSFGAGLALALPGSGAEHLPTGIATDPASGRLFVDQRTYVSVFEPSGEPAEEAGEPLLIGAGSLGEGYGVAVSGFAGDGEHAATAGRLYLPDAAGETVKVYDPGADPDEPVALIEGPPGGFTSLRDSAVAVDDATGEVYVVDALQPGGASRPRAVVQVFDAAGAYAGHLPYQIVHGSPAGLAVDNSGGPTQGRVYVGSGDDLGGGFYAYPPGAATFGAVFAPTIPGPAPQLGEIEPQIAIGGPAPAGSDTRIRCRGDACQLLPSEPTDPTLTTRLIGAGNPRVRYRRYRRRRRAQRRCRARKGHRRACRRRRATRRARASALAAAPAAALPRAGGEPSPSPAPPAAAPAATGPGPLQLSVEAIAADGEGVSEAGSHPYRLSITAGLDQGGGQATLRELEVSLPPGLWLNPAATSLCGATRFSTPRSSPFEESLSGEDCQERSQVGTVSLQGAAGAPRRFGLFALYPPGGSALRLAAAPYGEPLYLDGRIEEAGGEAHLTLAGSLPASLELTELRIELWGAPWEASHDGERGDCLNEAEPTFAWCMHSTGDPRVAPALALLTLPAACLPELAFAATARSWQGAEGSLAALARDGEGTAAALGDCAALQFEPHAEGVLSGLKASSATGFAFRLEDDDPGLARPGARIRARVRGVRLELPDGVTLNPSLGAGLGVCEPDQYAAESAATPPGQGCPDAAKIGDFSVRSPFYDGVLEGAVYLAAPQRNPYGALLAVYLVAQAADRGVLVKAAGRIDPDPAEGDLTATFEKLPQIPYTDLEVTLRSGQRAPLVTPGECGAATTKIALEPSSGAAPGLFSSDSQIESGIGGGPCPQGPLPFSPGVVAGGVNSNAGSYTPYFAHFARADAEQEITSYSLVLPRGITGRLAGIPFCSEAAIAAARARGGRAEAADPSCPDASRVGRTQVGYGVGPALAYAEGSIYLAGPYRGSALSLVTVNPALVGPFDLGTVVIRSAFSVDPRTAQLSVDSADSDPIPHILAGIPLHLRDIRVHIDRPSFTRNPTGCEPSQLLLSLSGAGERLGDPTDDPVATASDRFQLLSCRSLGFRPRLGLRLRGATRRGGFPALRATLAPRRDRDANLKRIEVTMSRKLFLANAHIRTICTRVQFAAERCPPGSVYGRAIAHTPLLEEPLRGRVYLRSSSHRLPDLVASLRSGSIRIELAGRIGSSRRGGIRAFFEELPDAPLRRFTMILRGGRHGLLTNSVDVCARPPRATIKALGQNDVGAIFTSELRGRCAKPGRRAARARASETAGKGSLRVSVSGELAPRALPRRGEAPVAVALKGEIATAEGETPPQLKRMRIELNRHGRLQTEGLPRCRAEQIHPATTAQALRACRAALVGRGHFSVDAVLAGQDPYPTTGRLLLFNGLHKGRPALLGQIYAARPFATSFLVPFAIGRSPRGRYGTTLSATVPPALASWGHVTGVRMRLARRYTYRGRRRSVISAGCPAPPGFTRALFPLARAGFTFAGVGELSTTLSGSCRVRR